MKVKIGPYLNWWGSYQIIDALFFWHEKYPDDKTESRWDYRLHNSIATWLSKTRFQTLCEWIYNKRKRKIQIHIDNYDIWGMDHTLALIILPMLKLLKVRKHGSPLVDDCDVPVELQSISAPPKENEWDTDEYYHKRWIWVLEEMIWAFEQIIDEDAEYAYFDPVNKEKYQEYQSRIQNGLILFGKYYRGLWD